MAQAGSVQREPSMEEILASIRRIIEDSDGGQAQPQAAARLADNAEDVENDGTDVEHFRAELKPSEAWTGDVEETKTSVTTIDDIEAAEEEGDRPPEDSTRRDSGAAEEVGLEPAQNASVLDWPVSDWGKATPEPDADEPAEDLGISFAEIADQREETDASTERRPAAIMSELAERKIAAAFDELNEAFEASRRRSLDEMAEEMLRPMLQDWLDNNLPLLVEKLVREEIERVARGVSR